MAVCPTCGQTTGPDDAFCQTCGTSLKRSDGQDEAAVESQSGSLPSARARVLIRRLPPESDPDAGPTDEREVALDGRNAAIGRSPSCDIVLDGDQLVSRRHALMRFDGQHFTIVDLGSSNGTYVNGVEIRELTPLVDSDHVTIGEHELIFSTAPASPHASLAGVQPGPVGTPAPATASYSANGASVEADGSDALEHSRPTAIPGAESDGAATAEVPAVSAGAAERALPATQADVVEQDGVGVPARPLPMTQQADLASSNVDAPLPLKEAEVGPGAALAVGRTVASAGPSHPLSGRSSSAEVQALSAQLRQLAEASSVIAERAEFEARLAEQRGDALSELRARLQRVMQEVPVEARAPEAAAGGTPVAELIEVARQAAENPRHLDYLTRLGEHAGEIADQLEQVAHPATPTMPQQVHDALSQVIAWLDAQG